MVIVSNFDRPLDRPREMVHVRDQASIEGHQQCATAVGRAGIGQIQGSKDGERGLSAARSAEHDGMPLSRKVEDLPLPSNRSRQGCGGHAPSSNTFRDRAACLNAFV